MKKIGNKIKQNAKAIVAFLLGIALTGGTVYAATVLPSSQVGYDNSTSGLAATDVQGALDELYQKAKIVEKITMQSFDSSMLPNVGDSMELKDTRDGNRYTVKKLKDGNVWMTENLRLIDKEISSADSNLSEGENWTVPASSAENAGYNTNKAFFIDYTNGALYTWYAATAGWGTSSVESGDSSSDICPKGWRIPTLNEYNALYIAYNPNAGMSGEYISYPRDGIKNSSSFLTDGDPGFILSGSVDKWHGREFRPDNWGDYVYRSTIEELEIPNSAEYPYGSYWSSTAKGGSYAGAVELHGDTIRTSSDEVLVGDYENSLNTVGTYKGAYKSVRCVAI